MNRGANASWVAIVAALAAPKLQQLGVHLTLDDYGELVAAAVVAYHGMAPYLERWMDARSQPQVDVQALAAAIAQQIKVPLSPESKL